jgi:hypothetical protein
VNQFILHGNVADRMVLPLAPKPSLGNLQQFLLDVLLPRFDVVLSYDLGNGVRIVKGGPTFTKWPNYKEGDPLPKAPRASVDSYALLPLLRQPRRMGRAVQVGASSTRPPPRPRLPGVSNYDLERPRLLVRDWSATPAAGHTLATFLVTENLNDLTPLLVNNARAARIEVPLPRRRPPRPPSRPARARSPHALSGFAGPAPRSASSRARRFGSLESLLKVREYKKASPSRALATSSALKKQLIERDANGLIEFVKPDRTLDDLHGQDEGQAVDPPGHRPVAERRPPGHADGLPAVRPRRHGQDVHGRVHRRRGGRTRS